MRSPRRCSLFVLSFLLLLVLAFPVVAQQEPAASQVASAPAEPSAQQSKPETIGGEVAHESREAAREEKDDQAKFKQSASVKLLARLTNLSLEHAYWLGMIVNFAVVAGLILWFGKKTLPGVFRDRTAFIQKAMADAQKASEDANRRLAEIESKLSRLDSEIADLRAAAEKEAAEEEQRIRLTAEDDARKIREAAELEIVAAGKAARRELTAYAADLAVALAKKQLHVDAATDQVLVRNFAQQISASAASPKMPGKDGQ